MYSLSYQRSLRVSKARFAAQMGQTGYFLTRLLAGLLVAGAALAWFGGQTGLAQLAAAAGIVVGMLTIWYSWELRELKAQLILPNQRQIALDQVVSADIVGQLSWPIESSRL